MESRDGTDGNWKSLSITLLEAGKIKELRALLAKIHLETGLTWEEVCKPSQFLWKDGKFSRPKGKGGEYALMLGELRRLKGKVLREQGVRIRRENEVMRRQITELKAKIERTRTELSENIMQNQNLLKCLTESNTKQRQLKSRCVDERTIIIV